MGNLRPKQPKPTELARIDFGQCRCVVFIWDATRKVLTVEFQTCTHDTGTSWLVDAQTTLSGPDLEDLVVGLLKLHADIRPRPHAMRPWGQERKEVVG
jgi:hypothetical protein